VIHAKNPLSAAFLVHVPQDRRERWSDLHALEGALGRLFEEGRRVFPALDVEPVDFAGFLGSILADDDAASLDSIRAADLFLVLAYGQQIPGASELFEQRYMPKIEAALGRIGTPAHVIADIQQDLRKRLVEMQDPAAERRGYSGRGDLGAWLCVSAVREAGRRRERAKKQTTVAEDLALASPEADPELAYLRKTYAQEFQQAFQNAFASLTSRERNLLRYHFVEHRSIDQIGGVYGVHRATAARWVNHARDVLCTKTRDLLAQRISFSEDGFRRMLSLIDSQISVRIALLEA